MSRKRERSAGWRGRILTHAAGLAELAALELRCQERNVRLVRYGERFDCSGTVRGLREDCPADLQGTFMALAREAQAGDIEAMVVDCEAIPPRPSTLRVRGFATGRAIEVSWKPDAIALPAALATPAKPASPYPFPAALAHVDAEAILEGWAVLDALQGSSLSGLRCLVRCLRGTNGFASQYELSSLESLRAAVAGWHEGLSLIVQLAIEELRGQLDARNAPARPRVTIAAQAVIERARAMGAGWLPVDRDELEEALHAALGELEDAAVLASPGCDIETPGVHELDHLVSRLLAEGRSAHA